MALLKVCGLTTIADLRLAQGIGADFLGLVVEASRSPRCLALPQAAVLARLTPSAVAVTRCDDAARLRGIVAAVHPRAVQLHGPHAAALADELRGLVPVWVAVGVPAAAGDADEAVAAALAAIAAAAAAGAEMIVLDTAVAGETGGTGRTSDWEVAARIVADSPLPVLLAGGIGPENAAAALARARPAGLDASSRLEAAPGRKDARKVRDLGRVVKP